MSDPPTETELGKVLDEYRISRVVVFVAWTATVIFGLIWVLFVVMAVGFTLTGQADVGGVLAGTVPISLVFCAAVYGTFRVQRTLVRCCENGFVYREGKQHYIVRYSEVSSADVVVEQRWRHSQGRRVMVEIRWLRVRLKDESGTEIRIRPLLFQDAQRLLKWQSLMRP